MKYILLSLLMVFSSSKYETQKYDLIFVEDNFEIRFYQATLKAKARQDTKANQNADNFGL